MNTIETTKAVTREELHALVDIMVEEKIAALLGDPEDELEIRDDLKERLLRQREDIGRGVNSVSFEEAMNRLGFE